MRRPPAGPRTALEAIKDERGMTWRDVARAIEREGFTVSEAHARRLGTGVLGSTPSPGLARAMERAFDGIPITALLRSGSTSPRSTTTGSWKRSCATSPAPTRSKHCPS